MKTTSFRSAVAGWRSTLLITGLGCLASVGSAVAAPTARITASRVSGPAPLAVFFDAAATSDSDTSVDPYRQLGYKFEFNDPNSGTWAHSGLPKTQQIGGPLAAHVFETPGTYSVQVTAKSSSGATSVASVTVTVQAADTVFSGRTVCIARGSDFTGCPSGATRTANASSWPRLQTGYRYLLRAGENFTSLGSLNVGPSIQDVQVSSFGSGSKPVLSTVMLLGNDPLTTNSINRIVVSNLNPSNINNMIGATDLLVLRNTITAGGMIDIAGAFDFYMDHSCCSGWKNPENIFIVENVVDRNFNSADNPNGIAGNAVKFAIMGNTVTRTHEHNIRIWQAGKLFVAHNNATGVSGGSIRHALKVHSAGTDPIGTLPTGSRARQRTSEVVVADNRFGSGSSNINWLVAFGPQNSEEIEVLEKIIAEDNRFSHGSNYYLDFHASGKNVTTRGNAQASGGRANESIGGQGITPAAWFGPYYFGQPSIKGMFSGGSSLVPRSPSALIVE